MELRKPVEMPELKTGMFGVEDDGEAFVVVNDLIVYEGGMYEEITTFDEYGDVVDDWEKDGTGYIDKLFAVGTAKCFIDAKESDRKPIWKHGDTE